MPSWSTEELDALKRAYASGTLRVQYYGRLVEYGSAEDLLQRIRTIEAEMMAEQGAGTARRSYAVVVKGM